MENLDKEAKLQRNNGTKFRTEGQNILYKNAIVCTYQQIKDGRKNYQYT